MFGTRGKAGKALVGRKGSPCDPKNARRRKGACRYGEKGRRRSSKKGGRLVEGAI